jgi:hypothetical protein
VFHARVEIPVDNESVVYIGTGCKLRLTEDPSLGPVTSKVGVKDCVCVRTKSNTSSDVVLAMNVPVLEQM